MLGFILNSSEEDAGCHQESPFMLNPYERGGGGAINYASIVITKGPKVPVQ
jgi:hypothetical protein